MWIAGFFGHLNSVPPRSPISQGYKSHELLEPVTAEDCAFYVEQVEQLQADNARLRERFSKDNSCKCNVCSACAERAASILASTDSSNWLAEQKAQWRREVLEEAAFKFEEQISHSDADDHDDNIIMDVLTAIVKELRRMAAEKRHFPSD